MNKAESAQPRFSPVPVLFWAPVRAVRPHNVTARILAHSTQALSLAKGRVVARRSEK